MHSLKIALLALVAGNCLFHAEADAGIIAQQEYDGTASAKTGFNGEAFDQGNAAPNLTYSTLTTAGSAKTIGGVPQLSLTAGNLSSTATYYISFLIDSTGVAGNATTEQRKGLTLFASGYHDGDNPTDPGAQVNGAAANTTASGGGTEVVEWGVRFGMVGYSVGNYGAASNRFQFMPSATPEVEGTHLYVISVTTDASTLTATISLFYDPANLAAKPLQTFKVTSFHLEQLRAYAFSGTFDEFRVGDTFADVAPGLPAAAATSKRAK